MKTLICLVLCALVASTYAAPASDRAEIQALLRSLQRQAEIEGWFSKIVSGVKKAMPYAKKGLDIYNKMNGGAEMQDDDDDDDDDIVQLQAFLSNTNEAEQQSFWSTMKSIGPGVLRVLGKK